MIALFGLWFAGCHKKPNDPYQGNACINRLRMIDAAKQEWGLEHHKTTNDVPTWDSIRFYLRRDGAIPTCPAGGTYTIGRLDQDPTCSYPEHKLP